MEVFGFEPGSVDRAGDGTAMHGEVKAGGATRSGCTGWHRTLGTIRRSTSAPRLLGFRLSLTICSPTTRRWSPPGGEVRSEPQDQPYGFREYAVADLDNRLWTFMTPIG